MQNNRDKVKRTVQGEARAARRLFLHYSTCTKEQIDMDRLQEDLSRLVEGFERIDNML